MDVPRREEACRGISVQKDRKQALLARLGFLDAAVAQEGPGCHQLREETEEAPSKTRSPLRSKQHPQKSQNRHYEEE
ncbi:hypothetical protein NDU88_002524 [Pleurodeles waltl]|uniref:Uncharacterized protein n=1 Tax=Pleurodeles waltl TaxID=8319 RepID=A0AAV7KSD5_PLEWA|nr:hypothetical protein NDU88_002524 [Pleurodeles waltl]